MAKCKYYKKCKLYDKEGATCNLTSGFYGERLASCYLNMEEKK